MLHTVLVLSTVAGDCLPKQPQNYLLDIITKKLKKKKNQFTPSKDDEVGIGKTVGLVLF